MIFKNSITLIAIIFFITSSLFFAADNNFSGDVSLIVVPQGEYSGVGGDSDVSSVLSALPKTQISQLYNIYSPFHSFVPLSECQLVANSNHFVWQCQTSNSFYMYAQPTKVAPLSPIHRMYNPNNGQHYYTLSDGERDALVRLGWRFENDMGFLSQTSYKGTQEIYHLYNPNSGDHIFTASASYRALLLQSGWQAHHSLGFGPR